MGQIDHVIWQSVIPDLPYLYDSAIAVLWRACRDEGQLLGVPVTPEIPVPGPEGAVEQGFSSGQTIHWDPEAGAYLC